MRHEERQVVLIAAADLHFSHKPPRYRAKESDWYEAMDRAIQDLAELAIGYGNPPIVYAGDIFDDGWRAHKVPPELINFVARQLPKGYAIPGQHDLPHHRYADVHKSAYRTLCEMGTLWDLPSGVPIGVEGKLWLVGMPWGEKIEQDPIYTDSRSMTIAVVHACCHSPMHTYKGAPKEGTVPKWLELLDAYDVAIFGDNHSGFILNNTEPTILNVGNFMRRKSNEKDPSVGLVYNDGTVERVELNTNKDIYNPEEEDKPETEIDVEQIKAMVQDRINFNQIDFFRELRNATNAMGERISEDVAKLIQEIAANAEK